MWNRYHSLCISHTSFLYVGVSLYTLTSHFGDKLHCASVKDLHRQLVDISLLLCNASFSNSSCGEVSGGSMSASVSADKADKAQADATIVLTMSGILGYKSDEVKPMNESRQCVPVVPRATSTATAATLAYPSPGLFQLNESDGKIFEVSATVIIRHSFSATRFG